MELICKILKSESFWETLIGSFVGTVTALVVFFLESRREKRKQKSENKEDHINALVYFKLLLENILTNTKNQSDAYLEQSKKITESPLKPVLIKLFVTNDVDRLLHKFSQERLFQAYTDQFGNKLEVIKEFKNIYSVLDFIESITRQANVSQEKYLSQLYSNLVLYKEISEDQALQNCISLLEKIRQTQDNFIDNELYYILNELILNYYNTSPTPLTVEHIQLNLISPLTNIILQRFRNNPEAFAILENCRKATWLYNDIIFKSQSVASEFKMYYIATKDVTEQLTSYKIIDNLNPKR